MDRTFTVFPSDIAITLPAMSAYAETEYSYDPLNRITAVEYLTDSSNDVSYTYDTDQVGNITQRGAVTFDYDALNRLTKVDGSTLSTTAPTPGNKISAAGNITDDGTRVYVWDDAGRLKEVEISSTTVGAYTYNASNQRAIKVASSVTTHYIYGAIRQKKFIASCRSWYCFFAEMDDLGYETIFRVAGPNGIIPFILYDETMSYCFGFDFDFEYSFFSSVDLKKDDKTVWNFQRVGVIIL